MRKLCVILLLILLLPCLPALAEEEHPLVTEGKANVLGGIAELAQAETGWQKAMMENTTIVSAKKGKEYVTVTVAIPTMKSGVGTNEKPGDDVAGYLSRAIAPLETMDKTTEYAVRIALKGKGDSQSLNWSTEKSLSGYMKKVNSMAASAGNSFEGTQLKSAVYRYLLPKAADMPKSKPKNFPAFGTLTDYCNAVAEKLGLTEQQANDRLPAMLLLMQLTKMNADVSLEEVSLTVKISDWQSMLAQADAAARAALPVMMGVPEMSREEIEDVFCQQLPAAAMAAYYGKNTTTETITVNLTAAIRNGVQESGGVVDYLAAYSAAVDAYIDSLMDFAATLDYYPQVPLIDTAILDGAAHASGTNVYFDTGVGSDHAYVCIKQGGECLLKGFIHNGVRLLTVLEPGEYEVYCAYGPTWFGEKYAFGRECFTGVFSLTVPQSGNLRVSIQAGEGSLPATAVDYAAFVETIGVVITPETEEE